MWTHGVRRKATEGLTRKGWFTRLCNFLMVPNTVLTAQVHKPTDAGWLPGRSNERQKVVGEIPEGGRAICTSLASPVPFIQCACPLASIHNFFIPVQISPQHVNFRASLECCKRLSFCSTEATDSTISS